MTPPRARGADLWTDVRITGLLPARVAESLGRGMPARVQLHAELWRSRSGWFDRLESGLDAEARIRFEVWNREYVMERRGSPAQRFESLDSLRTAVERPLALRVAETARLQPGGRYYVVVTVTLKPLSVEDVEEVEGWLSGEVDAKRSAGLGVITELPRALFDAVRNFSGFGDLRARAISETFAIADASP